MSRLILRVGLTGGIGAGKSTVDRMFEQLGAHVIDADAIVHRLLAAEAETIRRIAASFGPAVLDPSGGIDRRALARIAFADATARDRLNGILHPRVRAILGDEIERIRLEETADVVIVDAALLVETGTYRTFDRLVVLTAAVETRVARLAARDGASREEILARISAQLPCEAKTAIADYVVDNDGPLERTREQVGQVFERLRDDLCHLARGEPLPTRR